jgi:hypothetical protein
MDDLMSGRVTGLGSSSAFLARRASLRCAGGSLAPRSLSEVRRPFLYTPSGEKNFAPAGVAEREIRTTVDPAAIASVLRQA